MVLLDLLHIQRAGFFKFLKSGLNEELSQLNINIENTRLEVLPFTSSEAAFDSGSTIPKPLKPSKAVGSLLRIPTKTEGKIGVRFPKECSGKKDRVSTSQIVTLYPYPVLVNTSSISEEILLCPSLKMVGIRTPHIFLGDKQKYVGGISCIDTPSIRGTSTQPLTKKSKVKTGTDEGYRIEDSLSYASRGLSNITKKACFCLIAPKYTPREAILYQKSWSCKLVVKVSLTVPGLEQPIGENKLNHTLASVASAASALPVLAPLSKSNLSVKRQKGHELFLVLGELPLMTKRGHFIINGSPRVILSQLVRTPGIYFTERDNELQADCVPEQGPWLCISKNFRAPQVLAPITLPVLSPSESEPKGDRLLYPQKDVGVRKEITSLELEGHRSTTEGNKIPIPVPLCPSYPVLSSKAITRTLQKDVRGKEGGKQRICEANKAKVEGKVQGTGKGTSEAKRIFNSSKNLSSYFCYTKQFSSMPFSLIYSNFRIFELHSQFTDQTLLLTKLKTLEKIRQLRELITTLLTFTWKKRTRKRLQKLYTKRCFTATQQFEKTKIIFRLKRKLILGSLGRKSFNEKLGISNCENVASALSYSPSVSEGSYPFPPYLPYPSCVPRFLPLSQRDTLQRQHRFPFTPASASLSPRKMWGVVLPSVSHTFTFGGASIPPYLSGGTQHVLSPYLRFKEITPYSLRPKVRESDTEYPFGVRGKGRICEANKAKEGVSMQKMQSRESTYEHRGILSPLVMEIEDVFTKTGANAKEGVKQSHRKLSQKNRGLSLLASHSEGNGETTLLSQDLALIIRFLDSYKIMPKDDIDDLNNQRVRTSSDQVQQQVRVGCLRFRKMFIKLVRESWGVSQTITDLLNGALREFFGSNPLSQFLDQTNSLAEITHKRRISKLGLGGIQRESATLKVRTIHSTYFGRICPIETPEGVNAGLVNSLTCLSRVNEQGQLVTPLSPLMEKQLQNQFFYYSNQERQPLSTTDTALLKFQRLPNQFIYTKNESHFQQLEVHSVPLRVQSDLQTISLATALIPFLPYDDANRALMGSNMQRQAVPLILPERPMIRMGLESLVIGESGHSKESPTGGFVSYVSAQFVIIICHALNKRALSS